MKGKILYIFMALIASFWNLFLAWVTDFTSIPAVMAWIIFESLMFFGIARYYERTPIHEKHWIKIVLTIKQLTVIIPLAYAIYYQRMESKAILKKINNLISKL